MKKRDLLSKKMELFYNDISEKRPKNMRMRLQTDLEFKQNKIKNLNSKFNNEMFSSKVRDGKAFAAEQKIRDLKRLLLKSKNNKKRNKNRLNPLKLIQKATNNLNKTPTQKYGIEPEKVEEKSLEDDNFREKFDFHRLSKVGKDFDRRDRFNKLRDDSKNIKLRDPLKIGEKVLVLTERIKKKDAPRFLCKSTTQNRSFFNRDKIFLIRKRVKLENGFYYWLSEQNSNKINENRYLRQELFSLKKQWM